MLSGAPCVGAAVRPRRRRTAHPGARSYWASRVLVGRPRGPAGQGGEGCAGAGASPPGGGEVMARRRCAAPLVPAAGLLWGRAPRPRSQPWAGGVPGRGLSRRAPRGARPRLPGGAGGGGGGGGWGRGVGVGGGRGATGLGTICCCTFHQGNRPCNHLHKTKPHAYKHKKGNMTNQAWIESPEPNVD